MGLLWLSSLLLVIATLSGGAILYRQDVFFGINNQSAMEKTLSDNLITYSNASYTYALSSNITTTNLINDDKIEPYLPNGFKQLLEYSVVSGVDQTQNKWLIISFTDINVNRTLMDSFGSDILEKTILSINSQYSAMNTGYYQQVYVGENNSCVLSSNVITISSDIKQSFNQLCTSSNNNIGKYVLITKL